MSDPSDVSVEAMLDGLAERIVAKLAPELASERGGGADERSPWMAIEKAAAYLDWRKQRLYKLCASGAIPHYKQEGRLLFHRGELEAWLAQFEQGERASIRRPNES